MRFSLGIGTATLALISCDVAPKTNIKADSIDSPQDVAFDQIAVAGGGGRYKATRNGQVTEIGFPLPVTSLSPEIFHTGERLGESDSGVVVMVDEYASRSTDGRCSDGTEAFVRAFSLVKKRQVFVLPVESCITGLKGADPRAQWLGDGRFRVNAARSVVFQIEGDDRIVPVEGNR